MARVHEVGTIATSAVRVWDLIGDFHALPKWHPAIAKSTPEQRGDAQLRRLELPDGAVILERLEEKNDAERFYTYTIVESPLPIAQYRSTIHVRAAHDEPSCTVEWFGTFEVTGGAEEDAINIVRGVYTAGLDNLRRIFGS